MVGIIVISITLQDLNGTIVRKSRNYKFYSTVSALRSCCWKIVARFSRNSHQPTRSIKGDFYTISISEENQCNRLYDLLSDIYWISKSYFIEYANLPLKSRRSARALYNLPVAPTSLNKKSWQLMNLYSIELNIQ